MICVIMISYVMIRATWGLIKDHVETSLVFFGALSVINSSDPSVEKLDAQRRFISDYS